MFDILFLGGGRLVDELCSRFGGVAPNSSFLFVILISFIPSKQENPFAMGVKSLLGGLENENPGTRGTFFDNWIFFRVSFLRKKEP